MRKWIPVALVVAAVIAIPLACLAIERIGVPAYGNDSVVLIEHLGQSRGRLVNGTYLPLELSGKSYAFDAVQKTLGAGGLAVNDSLKAVIAVSHSLAQDAGSGADGTAYGVYDVPAAVADIVIRDVLPDGTVTMTYNGSSIVLAPGERWERISTDIVCTPDYSLRLTESDAIRNNGIIPKSAIN